MATGQAGRGVTLNHVIRNPSCFFQEYLKGEPSDFLVKEILKRKEHILQFNPKKRADGASLRENACKEVTEVFNRLVCYFLESSNCSIILANIPI